MKVGIVQPVIGPIGGNDSTLRMELEALKDHDVTLLTMSKTTKDYGVNTISKIPIKLPILGIYQNLLMPQHDYSKYDIILSNGYQVKTEKPVVIYDVNQMANDFTGQMSEKYSRGFWKVYATPYKLLRKLAKHNDNAVYYSCSDYSANALQNALAVKVGVLYPGYDDTGIHIESKQDQICVMGRISPEKNLEMAIEIINASNSIGVIAGSVSKTNQPYLEKLKKLANPNVYFVTNPDRQHFLHIMSESKIILSSSKETFGIANIEGIASGCIPIIPDNSANPETVPFNSLRYSTINDAVEKINRILNNNSISSTMNQRCNEHITQFTKEDFCKNLITILEDNLV